MPCERCFQRRIASTILAPHLDTNRFCYAMSTGKGTPNRGTLGRASTSGRSLQPCTSTTDCGQREPPRQLDFQPESPFLDQCIASHEWTSIVTQFCDGFPWWRRNSYPPATRPFSITFKCRVSPTNNICQTLKLQAQHNVTASTLNAKT